MAKVRDWYQWTPAEAVLWGNMQNIHDASLCYGRPCPVHGPSDHHMRSFLPHWRSDRGILERICPHGIGHPDPDQVAYWNETGQDWQAVHGCDGCCSEVNPTTGNSRKEQPTQI